MAHHLLCWLLQVLTQNNESLLVGRWKIDGFICNVLVRIGPKLAGAFLDKALALMPAPKARAL